jgi:hypothetical protein
MKRRAFIALLGGATAASAAWPLAAGAQTSPKIPRIGYIAGAGSSVGDHIVAAFRQGLTQVGHVKGERSYWRSDGPRGAPRGSPNW